MERMIQQVQFPIPKQPKLKRVAAYARVSNGKDAMLYSLSAQVSYYSELIQNHNGWLYCGVYADEALTGTKVNRENFQKMLAECRAGKLDLILTKINFQVCQKYSDTSGNSQRAEGYGRGCLF